MPRFRVGVPCELSPQQLEAATAEGFTLDTTTFAGFGGKLDAVVTYLIVDADDESHAEGWVTEALKVEIVSVYPIADSDR
jgi:hypothetical protein